MFKKVISFLLAVLMLTSVAFAADFNDFAADHWAYKFVDALVSDGTINGYEDGSFRPGANVTRAELAKLITVQFGESETKAYSDVSEDAWYYDYVTAAGSYFLAEGEFAPSAYATREEVAYAIYAAKKFTASDVKTAFTDANDIANVYQDAVASVANNGIITGYPDGTFLPKNNITRAETATVLYRAIHLDDNASDNTDSANDIELELFNATDLLLKKYDASATIKYGELSMAALRLYNNEWDVAYYNLGDVVGKKPFDHPDALALWLIGRDVLGEEIVTEAIIDTPISVGDAIKVLSYYSERKDYDKRKINQDILLQGVDRKKNITHKDFAQLITEIDSQIGMMVKTVVNSGNTAKKLATPLRKDLASYPSTKNKFQVVLEDVPNKIYETAYDASSASLKTNYAFAREMASFLLNPIHEFCQIAAANGAEIQISYYQSLILAKDNVYTMRVELEVLSVTTAKNLKDICKTSIDRPIKAGDKFFCDLNSNAKIPSASINGGVMSIDKIID